MEISSELALERANVQQSQELSTSIEIGDVAEICGEEPLELEIEGLGLWDFFVLKDATVGFISIGGSQAYPEVGASVRFETRASESELLRVLRTFFLPHDVKFMYPDTGEFLD